MASWLDNFEKGAPSIHIKTEAKNMIARKVFIFIYRDVMWMDLLKDTEPNEELLLLYDG